MKRLAMILAIGMMVLALAVPACAQNEKVARKQVKVYVECIVIRVGKPSTYTAHYRIENPNAYVVPLVIGPLNHFEQEVWNQGQPTWFWPGTTLWTRTVPMWMDTPGGGYSGWWSHPIWWHLDGNWAFADGMITKRCQC